MPINAVFVSTTKFLANPLYTNVDNNAKTPSYIHL